MFLHCSTVVGVLLLLAHLPLPSRSYTWEPLACFNVSEAVAYLNMSCQLEAACRFESTGVRNWHTLLVNDLQLFTANPLLDARKNFELPAWRAGRLLVDIDGATHCTLPTESTAVPMVVGRIVDLITKQTHYVFEEGRCDVNWVPVLLPATQNITCTCAPGKACVASNPVAVFFMAIACVVFFIAVSLMCYNIWLGRSVGRIYQQFTVEDGADSDAEEMT